MTAEVTDLLTKEEHDGGQFQCEPFSEAADRITACICSRPLPWIDCYGEAERHDLHGWMDSCAICKAGYAPWALRVVIDAVLDAALSDPAIADALVAARPRALRPESS